MSAGKRSCPDLTCYLLSVVLSDIERSSRTPDRSPVRHFGLRLETSAEYDFFLAVHRGANVSDRDVFLGDFGRGAARITATVTCMGLAVPLARWQGHVDNDHAHVVVTPTVEGCLC